MKKKIIETLRFCWFPTLCFVFFFVGMHEVSKKEPGHEQRAEAVRIVEECIYYDIIGGTDSVLTCIPDDSLHQAAAMAIIACDVKYENGMYDIKQETLCIKKYINFNRRKRLTSSSSINN